MVRTLYTVGYEGLTIDEFLSLVVDSPIDLIIDTRWTPLSRKPGFSRSGLQQRLMDRRKEYVHIPQLGSPKVLRQELSDSHDWSAFARKYLTWLNDQEDALASVRAWAVERVVGLLCFEANPHRCHRSLVATTILERLEGYAWSDLSRHGEKMLRS